MERKSRRRRMVVVGIAAALAVAAGSAGITEAIVNEPAAVVAQPPAPQQFIPAETGLPVAASAVITDVPGGTRIAMTCQYSGPLPTRATPRRRTTCATCRRTAARRTGWTRGRCCPAHPYRMEMVVPLPRDKISKFEVTWNGKAVLSLPAS